MADSGGLYLLTTPTGSKLWRLDYRFFGNRKTLALGVYPRRSLADARRARDEAKEKLERGIDPSETRRLEVIYLIAKPKFALVPKSAGHGDVWDFMQEVRNDHPAPFPVPLIERIITSTSARVVFDPFIGSGTTAIAAINHQRAYIGIDLSPEYCANAGSRFADHRRGQRVSH